LKYVLKNLVLVLLLKASTLSGQNLVDIDFEKANKLYSDGFFKEAYVAFEQVAPKLLAEKKMDLWTSAVGRCAENQMYFLGETSKADSLLKIIERQIQNSKSQHAFSILYFFKGNYHDFIAQPDSALHYLALAEKLSLKMNDSPIFKAEMAQSIGNVYRWSFYNFYQAEKYYRAANTLLENSSESRLLASVCYNLATVLRLKGDYEGGLEMAYKSLALYKKIPSNTERQTINIYTAIANIYFETERFEKAIETLSPLLKLLENMHGRYSPEMLGYHHNIIAYFYKMEDYRNSDSHLTLIKNIIDKNNLEGQALADYYFQLGIGETATQNWSRADNSFIKCEDLRLSLFGTSHPQLGQVWFARSELFALQKKHIKALEYIQKSIYAYLPQFDYANDLVNPDTLTYSGKDLANAFVLKGDILLEMYKSNKQTRFLFQAFDTYQKAMEVIRLNRMDFEQEQSQLFAASYSKKIYEKALQCLYILQENSPKNKTDGLAFEIMGQSKATLLKEQINKSALFKSLGVPDSILTEEANLRSAISILQNHLRELGGQAQMEMVIREKIFIKNQMLEKLKTYLISNYPIYSELRFGKQNIKAADVKMRLAEKEATLVEYFWGENTLFALVIGADFEKLYSFPQTKESYTHLKVLIQSTRKFSSELTDFQSFTNSSSYIYKKWWQPFDSLLTEKVSVVPDGPLSFLPFDVLLSQPVKSSFPNYKTLPYLILKRQINYNYSSDLKGVKKSDSKTILAMGYSAPGLPKEDGFDPLEGAYIEIERISKLMEGEFLTGTEASKIYFQENASRFGYLHLALHGVGDTTTFYKSHIHFRGQSLENNDLYINELYGLRLNGTQVMLSACETGLGEEFSGEGVYSLGRAFLQAGASSVVQTLWKVPDQVSLRIITDYYQLISNKTEAGTALRKSKMQFLQQSDELNSHPAFWAAWCYIGEENEEPFSPFTYWPAIVGLILFLGAIGVFVLRKRL